jgi:hypothetical protein
VLTPIKIEINVGNRQHRSKFLLSEGRKFLEQKRLPGHDREAGAEENIKVSRRRAPGPEKRRDATPILAMTAKGLIPSQLSFRLEAQQPVPNEVRDLGRNGEI